MPTLARYADAWIDSQRARLAAQSLVNYECVLRRHVLDRLGDRDVAQVTTVEIRDVLARMLGRGYARATVQTALAAVSSLFAHAVLVDRLRDTNPALGASYQLWTRRELPPRALHAADLARLLDAVDARAPHLGPFVRLLAHTGLRIGEALALRDTVVDLREAWIYVDASWNGRRLGEPKTATSRRYVDASPAALAVLEPLLRRRGWLFPGRRETPYTPRAIQGVFQRAVEAAQLPRHVTPHALRHTWATAMREAGAPLDYLREQLGHASVRVTEGYTRHRRQRQPEYAAAADRVLGGEVAVRHHRPALPALRPPDDRRRRRSG